MQHAINDSFMNPDRFGYAVVPFKIDGNREALSDIPKWRINRTNARSMGKPTYLHTKPCRVCLSLVRRVYNNECFDCFSIKKK